MKRTPHYLKQRVCFSHDAYTTSPKATGVFLKYGLFCYKKYFNPFSRPSSSVADPDPNIIHFFFIQILNPCLTDINIYPINNKTDKFSIFLIEKKVFKKVVFSRFRSDSEPLFHETDPRIRIHIKMKLIRNTGRNITLLVLSSQSLNQIELLYKANIV